MSKEVFCNVTRPFFLLCKRVFIQVLYSALYEKNSALYEENHFFIASSQQLGVTITVLPVALQPLFRLTWASKPEIYHLTLYAVALETLHNFKLHTSCNYSPQFMQNVKVREGVRSQSAKEANVVWILNLNLSFLSLSYC